MNKRYAFVLLALAVAVVMLFVSRDRKRFFTNEGVVWTTEYHITYEADRDLGDSIQLIFNNLKQSLQQPMLYYVWFPKVMFLSN